MFFFLACRVCRSGCALQISFRTYEGKRTSPRLARYRVRGMHSLLTSPLAKADYARMYATGGRSSAAIEQKKRRPFGCRLFYGSGTRIRTQTYRVRVCCATVTQFPNMFAVLSTAFTLYTHFIDLSTTFYKIFQKFFQRAKKPVSMRFFVILSLFKATLSVQNSSPRTACPHFCKKIIRCG